jgi:hypothetical protein
MPSDWYEVHTAFFDTNRKLDLPKNQRSGKAWGEKEEGNFMVGWNKVSRWLLGL